MKGKKYGIICRVLIGLLAAGIITAGLIGLNSLFGSDPPDVAEAAITVYYVSSAEHTSYFPQMIEAAALPEDLVLDVREFESYTALKQAIDKDGIPDLVLLDEWDEKHLLDPRKLAEEGRLCPLDLYLTVEEATGTYREEDYFPGTLQTGRIEDRQMMLPLTVRTTYWITTQEKADLITASSGREEFDLLAWMRTVYAMEEESETNDTILPVGSSILSLGQSMEEILRQTGIVTLDLERGRYTADRDTVKTAVDYLRVYMKDYTAYWKEAYSTGTPSYQELTERYELIQPNANMPFYVRYWYSANTQLGKGTATVLWTLPLYDSDEKAYQVAVGAYALVGADTGHEEAAYQIARALMDIPSQAWLGAILSDPVIYMTSVNRQTFLEEVFDVQVTDVGSFRLNPQTVFGRKKLSDELGKQMKDWAMHVTSAYAPDPLLQEILEKDFRAYITGASDDFDSAYEALLEDMIRLYEKR